MLKFTCGRNLFLCVVLLELKNPRFPSSFVCQFQYLLSKNGLKRTNVFQKQNKVALLCQIMPVLRGRYEGKGKIKSNDVFFENTLLNQKSSWTNAS